MGVHSIDAEDDQFAYRYDTQLLIDRRDRDLDEDEIADYITENFEGNSLIAAGDEDLVKIHFHTNEPWKILEYCNTVGEIYDIVVEDMIRQAAGQQGCGKKNKSADCAGRSIRNSFYRFGGLSLYFQNYDGFYQGAVYAGVD